MLLQQGSLQINDQKARMTDKLAGMTNKLAGIIGNIGKDDWPISMHDQ